MANKDIFVRAVASGDGTGLDWYNAYTTLQDALTEAMAEPAANTVNVYVDDDIYTLASLTVSHNSINLYGGNILTADVVVSGYNEIPVGTTFKSIVYLEDSVYVQSGVFITDSVRFINSSGGYAIQGEDLTDILLKKVNFETDYGIDTSGNLRCEFINAISYTPQEYTYGFGGSYIAESGYSDALSGNIFINSVGEETVVNNSSMIGYYNTIVFNGINDNECIIDDVLIKQASNGIVYQSVGGSGTLRTNNIVIYDTDKSFLFKDTTISGGLNGEIGNCTLYTPYSFSISPMITGLIQITDSIMSGEMIYGDGSLTLTTEYTLLDTTPSGYGFVPGTGIVYGDPKYIDVTKGDFSLGIGTADDRVSSDGLNVGSYTEIGRSIQLSDSKGFRLSDSSVEGYDMFLHKSDETVVWSDHMKEIPMATFRDNNGTLSYVYNHTTTVVLSGVVTIPAFSREPSLNDWMYEWDYEIMNSPGIENNPRIIPKSIIDITNILQNIDYGKNKSNISVRAFKNIDNRGISYDYDSSNNTSKIVWSLDGDQMLTKTDFWNGNVIDKYPLVPPIHPSGEKLFIKPSGLIPYGVNKYVTEDDPDTILESVNDDGSFEWLSTEKHRKWDLKGILTHKGTMYVTASFADQASTTPYVLIYPSRGYYADYQCPDPTKLELHDDNNDPRGITVYEDGSILISNYDVMSSGIANYVNIFHYKPCFDYALKENNNYMNTKLILREAYDEVTLEQALEEPDTP